MQNIYRFDLRYFFSALMLFGAELFIGFCMHDRVVRPYGGDFLVVILLYCMVRSFWDGPILATALSVLLFAYLIEVSQYFRLADHLGLKAHSLARILLGSDFSWVDMLAYTLGIFLVVSIERRIRGPLL
jgi:hypothetical protein